MDWSRFKNYGLWVSIFAFVPLLLKAFGVNVLPDNYQDLITAFLSILVMAGIISNPATQSKWYLDDQNSPNTIKEVEKPKELK